MLNRAPKSIGMVAVFVLLAQMAFQSSAAFKAGSKRSATKESEALLPPLFPPHFSLAPTTAPLHTKTWRFYFSIPFAFGAVNQQLVWQQYIAAVKKWAKSSNLGVHAEELVAMASRDPVEYERVLDAYTGLLKRTNPNHPMIGSVNQYKANLGKSGSLGHYGALADEYAQHLDRQAMKSSAVGEAEEGDSRAGRLGVGAKRLRQLAEKCRKGQFNQEDALGSYSQFIQEYHGAVPVTPATKPPAEPKRPSAAKPALPEALLTEDDECLDVIQQVNQFNQVDPVKQEHCCPNGVCSVTAPKVPVPNDPKKEEGVVPKNLALSPVERNIDLSICPPGPGAGPIAENHAPYSQGDFVSIGDLHGNFAKLVFFLVKEGVASFDSKNQCQALLDFYYKDPRAPQVPIPQEILKLIAGMHIKHPPEAPLVRLMGDELADRGKNDALTIEVLKLLHEKQPGFEIMVSNHGIEFLREMVGLESILHHDPTQDKSLAPIARNEAEKPKYVDFLLKQYLPHLKLVSTTQQKDIVPVVYTHAPTDPKRVALAAGELGVGPPCDRPEALTKEIARCSAEINRKYIGRLRRELQTPPPADQEALSRKDRALLNRTATGERDPDPIADLFWMRNDDGRFSDRNTTGWKTANGHDKPRGNGRGSTFELDNDLGKGSGSSTGDYQVLRPY